MFPPVLVMWPAWRERLWEQEWARIALTASLAWGAVKLSQRLKGCHQCHQHQANPRLCSHCPSLPRRSPEATHVLPHSLSLRVLFLFLSPQLSDPFPCSTAMSVGDVTSYLKRWDVSDRKAQVLLPQVCVPTIIFHICNRHLVMHTFPPGEHDLLPAGPYLSACALVHQLPLFKGSHWFFPFCLTSWL